MQWNISIKDINMCFAYVYLLDSGSPWILEDKYTYQCLHRIHRYADNLDMIQNSLVAPNIQLGNLKQKI